MSLIHEFTSGEKVFLREDTLIVFFPEARRAAGTSMLNGGCREDLRTIFNHHLPEIMSTADLPGGSVEKYLSYLCSRLDLPVDKTTGFLTAARMENAAIKTSVFNKLEVTAIVTAGVDVNGGRAGDPAQYDERGGRWAKLDGTIIIFLLINGNLPPYTLLRSLVTATEAKAAALAELAAPSCYSSGIATGSGTDQIIAVANPKSPLRFTDAGKHSKLGELIGVTVKEGVKTALEKETGLNQKRQCSILARFQRYGVTLEHCRQFALREGLIIDLENYRDHFQKLDQNEHLVALASGIVHLLDEYEWGLLSGKAVVETGINFIRSFESLVNTYAYPCGTGNRDELNDPIYVLKRHFFQAVNQYIKKIRKNL